MGSQSLFLLYKEFLEVLPSSCTNMGKAVILLTVSADKPDTAFYHQRNCLAGILKSQRNTTLESSKRDSPGSEKRSQNHVELVSAGSVAGPQEASSLASTLQSTRTTIYLERLIPTS